MRTVIVLPMEHEMEIPKKFRDEFKKNNDDFRFPESLVRFLLEEYTKPGDIVLDIFAGLGTTLFVADSMGRIPYGIELDRECFEFIRNNLVSKDNIIHGDTRKLAEYDLPKIDLVVTSPPYMRHTSQSDPFTVYTEEGNYSRYLDDMSDIFRNLNGFLAKDGYVVVEVANLKGNEVTTLAWDVGRAISNVLHFEGEIIISWEGVDDGEGVYGYGYDHSYCLVFRKK